MIRERGAAIEVRDPERRKRIQGRSEIQAIARRPKDSKQPSSGKKARDRGQHACNAEEGHRAAESGQSVKKEGKIKRAWRIKVKRRGPKMIKAIGRPGRN